MDPSLGSNKRPPDRTFDLPTPTPKRRPHPPPAPSPSAASPVDTVFRLLCPSSKTGALIGKGGSVIRHFRELTGARIHVDDSAAASSDERVIVIASNANSAFAAEQQQHGALSSNNSNSGAGDCDDGSPAQQALIRIFEKMARVDEDKPEDNINNGGGSETKNSVTCRLLAQSNQVGCVLGRGGKIVEKIRQETGAQIRVLPKDQLPACASHGDELIQITGHLTAVKKALLSVSSCLQDNPRVDAVNSGAFKPSGGLHGAPPPAQVDPYPHRGYASGIYAHDHHSRGYSSFPGPAGVGAGHRMFVEDEVVFKLLCQQDKVGSLIGKGGSVVRSLESETGASIKIADSDLDERVVVISARENPEQKHSPAQDAVIRVHCKLAEIGFEPGAASVARLLVHSPQIGCLLGKGGSVISEMRRATGANIRIFPKEQVKGASQNEEIVQVIGSPQSVQDALFHITSRIRETIFPIKVPPPNFGPPHHLPPFSEMPPPLYRPRNPPMPSGHPPQVGPPPPHGIDHLALPSQPIDPQHSYFHGAGRGPPTVDRIPYPRGYEGPNSPRSWNPQAVSRGNTGGTTDASSVTSRNMPPGRNGNPLHNMTSTTVEVTIPQMYLPHVHGDNNSNLIQIQQISGANVVVHDPNPGASEGLVIVSGAPDQTRAAQTLIQAFIFCGQTAA
ncbi:hypothetical protein QN277_024451 [Acacia crassicarpa]|uniref:K Homology domain-containing protein n=1 Tax=Acacia crassicarpa TaxID=499986 RepID=A0AAE1JEU1_9FABA|nr:hypothetical protein QN277_024451 [Acacia crassicarpa]